MTGGKRTLENGDNNKEHKQHEENKENQEKTKTKMKTYDMKIENERF